MEKKCEVERKNREKMTGGRKKKWKRGEVLGLGLVKKKDKREKERENIDLIKEERETN